MQRYLLSAAVFPGLLVAWQSSSNKQVAYAKSSSHSSKSSSHSSSSSSHSSSSSSHSFLSSSSKASSGTKSLTQKRSQHSSTAHNAIAPKHISTRNGKKYINRRSYNKSRQENKAASILGCFALLGVCSKFFFNYERLRYSIPRIRQIISQAEPINLNVFSTAFEGKLVAGSGKINVLQKSILKDAIFGVEATQSNVLAIVRKVDVFIDSTKENEKGKWETASYAETFDKRNFERYMTERYTLPKKVMIGEFELSDRQLVLLGEEKEAMQKLSFDTDLVDEVFQSLKDEAEEIEETKYNESKASSSFFARKQPEEVEPSKSSSSAISEEQSQAVQFVRSEDSTPSPNDLISMYEQHPFRAAQSSGKQIVYENDYIYIVNDMNNPSAGDIRISFHEIKPILEASLIAQQKGKSFIDFEIEDFKKMNLNLRLFVGGKEKMIKFNFINLIKDGNFTKSELIETYVKKLKSDARSVSIILALIIYIIYAAIVSSIGQSLNPLNWFGKNAQQRRINSRQTAIQQKGKGTTINSSELGFLSYLIAAPFAGVHIGALSLFALARTYAAILAGGAVGSYLLFTIIQDYKFEQDLLKSIPKEEEEEYIEPSEVDDDEQRIMSMLAHNEKKEI